MNQFPTRVSIDNTQTDGFMSELPLCQKSYRHTVYHYRLLLVSDTCQVSNLSSLYLVYFHYRYSMQFHTKRSLNNHCMISREPSSRSSVVRMMIFKNDKTGQVLGLNAYFSFWCSIYRHHNVGQCIDEPNHKDHPSRLNCLWIESGRFF